MNKADANTFTVKLLWAERQTQKRHTRGLTAAPGQHVRTRTV